MLGFLSHTHTEQRKNWGLSTNQEGLLEPEGSRVLKNQSGGCDPKSLAQHLCNPSEGSLRQVLANSFEEDSLNKLLCFPRGAKDSNTRMARPPSAKQMTLSLVGKTTS